MVDAIFEHPRLVAVYDALDSDRRDLKVYAAPPSDSTLRFQQRDEVEDDLTAAGFVVDDVRDAPDRLGGSWCS